MPLEKGSTVEQISGKITTALGPAAKVMKTDNVSGKVSDELFTKGILACLLAVIGIGAYVWFRFEFKFGTGAFLTTFHDVYAVIGLWSVTQMTFDLTIVAGVLTVAGYSINDTVVVYDRIREMLKKFKKLTISQVIDISITATLSRTLMTSITTMLAALAMVFLGGAGAEGLRHLDRVRHRHRHVLVDLRRGALADPPAGPHSGREIPWRRVHRREARADLP